MKLKKYILPLCLLSLLSACEDYEDINKSTTGVTDEELGSLLYATKLTEIQKYIIPIGTPAETTAPGNDLMASDVMSAGNYIGYFGMNHEWGYKTEATWDFAPNRMEYEMEVLYAKPFTVWTTVYQKLAHSEDVAEQEIMALFDIIKVTAWLRATDCFGPLAYTSAGNGDFTPKFDSQETVYRSMLKDLERCSQILNASTSKIMPKYDMVYGGDPVKWTKFANSLMLRIAVRTHFVNEELAREYITKALDPQNGGVIETIADEAKIGDSGNFPLLNPLIAGIDYKETRMGATAWHYLTGYKDPRLAKYYTKGVHHDTEDYYCIAPCNTVSKQEGKNSAEFASTPNVSQKSPMYWFRASETFFLKAEAALYNLAAGDVAALYEQGVRTSMQEWGISDAEATAYLADGESTAGEITYDNYYYNDYGHYYTSNISEGNVSPKWDANSGKEKQLQQIITQKYIALYPNSVEAWTEYRRTGYPYLAANFGDFYNKINSDRSIRTPERYIYSPKDYSTNPNMNEIPELLGGKDQGGTKLWWVRKDRPKQR